jgi:hypothetical protein
VDLRAVDGPKTDAKRTGLRFEAPDKKTGRYDRYNGLV